MELRRALLLFAIVLGVAAVVAALANPPTRGTGETTATAPPDGAARESGDGRPPTRVRVDGRGAPRTVRLEIGRATTVVVAVDEPGQVTLDGLGLTDTAEPRDPAVFETLPSRRGRYEVLFTPAGGVRERALGALVSHPSE